MKHAVVNLMKCTDNTIIASNHIARYLAMQLGAPLLDSPESASGRYYRLYVVNGPMLYCGFREQLKELVSKAHEVFWIQNDYAIVPPPFIKNHPGYGLLSACDNFKRVDRYAYVNWNQLTFEQAFQPRQIKYKGICYYGAYREGREKYFREYLAQTKYNVHISSSRNGAKKFWALNPVARYFDGGRVYNFLGEYQAVIYMEDEKSHEIYTSPANRFYEALTTHTLQFFDKAALGTFDRAGIAIGPWVVQDREELAQKLSDSDRLRSEQLGALRTVDYRARLGQELKTALSVLR